MRQSIHSTIASMALLGLALAGCASQNDQNFYDSEVAEVTASESADLNVDAEAPGQTHGSLAQLGSLPVSLPKLAYVFDYSWRLPAQDIGALQRRHADMCEQQGPLRCRIIGMNKSGETNEYASGELQLAVASDGARSFGTSLEDEASKLGAEQESANIQAEELSKQIVDTEARLRSRIELRDRLMDLLRTRQGDVSELVRAERSVAEVNEEIDRAQSWLSEMRQRVAFSRINITYESGVPSAGAFIEPVRGALGSVAGIFGNMTAALILFAALAIPLGLLAAALRWGWRRSGFSLPVGAASES